MQNGDGREINQDALDLAADAEVSIIKKLSSLRGIGDHTPIDNLEEYTKRVARNAFGQHLRRLHPVRSSLKNQIRYAVSKHADLWLLRDDEGAWMCGFGENRKPSANRQNGESIRAKIAEMPDERPTSLPRLIATILEIYSAPVPLERLVSDVFEILSLAEPTTVTDEDGRICSHVPPSAAPQGAQFEQREFLTKLWHEVVRLPLLHRQALLLNLTNREGESLIAELPILRIASVRTIAEALEINSAEFAELWPKLPLNDNDVAGLIGLTRQQVINLRHSARATLKRRFERGSGTKY